ncbi:PTS sorbose transporter subunit IIB [Lactiplantibacillus plantarum]|uniref:PTS sugar transporter subunit IIB n=1 Tax=Lactiplantibacillus plantarum TaxID=1590 RepID=UPI000DADDF53|nr:PTS sugar transporter subunit IIB [Lactiplantibacillus plantarum]KAF1280901.1 PTS mannose/fructose/sorbose transporter subunit IIB [Lactiplantibacillus plantarum]RAH93778.1 PTS mannose/fructose/sorbose transporter subunit IIB [Lactiplantibacillus plantarum]GCD87873.1 PTS sorbose transporter subunit IIB [Lactiplantibacillus plantarum]
MIKFIRVDHRLLHGQVALSWFGATKANCILIANDEVPNDTIRKATIKMARPNGAKLVIMPIDKSIDQINGGITDKYDLMIVVETINDAYRLISGLDNKPIELNLGGTKATEDTESLSTAVNVTTKDKEYLKAISKMGIKIYIQQVPTSASKTLEL